jgi:N-acetylglucosamine-6-phosphate deacetylase
MISCRVADDFHFKIGTFQHVLEGYKVADEIRESAFGASAFSDWWAYKVEVQDAIPFAGAIMHDAGILVSFNSDSDELARRMNVEAGKAVKYGGLDPAEALKFVTINPARQLRIDDRVGSLEVGKDADFAIWSVPHMGGPRPQPGSNLATIPEQTSPNGKHPVNAAPVATDAGTNPGAVPPSVDGTPLSTMARCEQTWIDGRCYFSLERDAELREHNAKERARIIQKLLAAGNRSAGRNDAGGPRPDGAGGPPRGRRGSRPTDDSITSGMYDAPIEADEAPRGLLQTMLERAADQRREYYLQLWRRGIDPDYARCGDCGESLGAMGGAQ